MPAPNLAALFDFEGQFETAAQGILANVLINAYASGQDENMPLMHTRIAFDVGPADEGKFAQLDKPAGWPDGMAAPQEYFIYSAALEYTVSVPRDDRQPTIAGVTSMLAQIRGQLREAMMQCVRPFNEVNLPYLKVSRIRPNGSSTQPGPEGKNTDLVFVRYDIKFEIRRNAWPAWVVA